MHKLLLTLTLAFLTLTTHAESPKLKAVMYVGGGFHDYKKMPGYLAEQIAHFGNIAIDVRFMAEATDMAKEFKDPNFGQGYDVIIYDICFGEKWQDGDYDTALKTAAAGKPAVFVHCAMHCYRTRDTKAANYEERNAICEAKWHALDGMDTRVHDKYQPFSVEKVAKDQPIVKTFPDDWKTPGDELYNTVKMMPTATPLLQAKSPISGKIHTVAWINSYGDHKTRVFGTTLGHDMKTGEDPAYHRLLAMGILWAADKLDADGKPIAGYSPAIDAPVIEAIPKSK